MKIQVEELRDLMNMISGEINERVNNHKGFSKFTDQEHTMECERNWEEGYDKGYQDAKNELKDLTEKKAISTQIPLEDLTPTHPIDLTTETHLNRNFTIPPRNFGHNGLMYKLSEKEYCKAIGFTNKTYCSHKEEDLTYSFRTTSDGIGIAITIICDQYPEEREDITDYSRW